MDTAIVVLLTIIAALAAKRTFAATPNITPVAGKKPAPKFDNEFEIWSRHYGVPKRLMVALVAHESAFNEQAVNEEVAADKRKGRDVDSLGLAQILWPDTAKALEPDITRERLFYPAVSLRLQGKLLQALLRMWKGTYPDGFPSDAVAAYNAGSPKFRADGSYINQEYVDKVHTQWRKYADV